MMTGEKAIETVDRGRGVHNQMAILVEEVICRPGNHAPLYVGSVAFFIRHDMHEFRRRERSAEIRWCLS
jgi:hypothetical protein